jgi:hypothetical protein
LLSEVSRYDSQAPYLHTRGAKPCCILQHRLKPQAGRVVGSRAAIAAQQLATVAALHAVADVAVRVCAVNQGAKLLEGQVVHSQVRELRRASHLWQAHNTQTGYTSKHRKTARTITCIAWSYCHVKADESPHAAQQLEATSADDALAYLAACMFLKHTVGHLLVALAA